MTKTMLKKKRSIRNPDLWRSLPNASKTDIEPPSFLRGSQEIKPLYSPERGNTPIGFDRIYNGKSMVMK